MAELSEIPVSNLLLDHENPRLAQSNVGQREAMREIAQDQQSKILKLAQHIVRHGPNLSELPIVTPIAGRRFIVLEGNRRLTAIRVLENPDLLSGVLMPAALSALRKLSAEYQENPVEALNCLVVEDRDEARVWIELRHTGENEGAGIVRWNAHEAGRFRARSRELEPHLQALDFLETLDLLPPELRKKLPTTSFKRLLSSPAVREKIGVDIQDGKFIALGNASKVGKAVLHVVKDLATGRTKTEDIYTKEDRENYANNLPRSVVVSQKGGASNGKAGTSSKRARSGSVRIPGKRDRLIPNDCALGISDPRVREIEHELRKLSLKDHTNAISVLYRVFLELSCDDYIKRSGLIFGDRDALASKLKACADHLVKAKKLDNDQAKPVRRAAQKDSFFAPSVTLMNQYVHNRYVFPEPGDLRAQWNSLQPFFIAVWMP